jgi:hypothetical protein
MKRPRAAGDATTGDRMDIDRIIESLKKISCYSEGGAAPPHRRDGPDLDR